jgi:hypothetical protein
MKLELEVKQPQKITIDIEFPFYYRHDFDWNNGESYLIGKITENKKGFIINYTDNGFGEIKYEFEIEENISYSSYFSYITDNWYKSSEQEYNQLLEEAKLHINKF